MRTCLETARLILHAAGLVKTLMKKDKCRRNAVRQASLPGFPLLLALLAGCAAPESGTGASEEPAIDAPEAPGASDLQQRQERACAAATADHLGRGLEAVSPSWRGPNAAGNAEVEVRDGERLHVCEIDASAQPIRLEHPPA